MQTHILSVLTDGASEMRELVTFQLPAQSRGFYPLAGSYRRYLEAAEGIWRQKVDALAPSVAISR